MGDVKRELDGWKPHWGLFDVVAKEWDCHDALHMWWHREPGTSKRWSWGSFREAMSAARIQLDRGRCCIPRRFWRRLKPKQPPPLAVGDEVVVRGKVVMTDGESIYPWKVETRSGQSVWLARLDVERPGWWNGVKP